MHGLACVVVVGLLLGGAFPGYAPAAELAPPGASLIEAAAQSGLMEVAAAKVALDASKSPAVKEYAYRIIQDRQRMNEELARIAGKRGAALPAELDTENTRMLRSLRDAPQGAFDALYLQQMILGYKKLMEVLQSNLLNSDAELAIFSSYNLPRLKGHMLVAEELKARSTPAGVSVQNSRLQQARAQGNP